MKGKSMKVIYFLIIAPSIFILISVIISLILILVNWYIDIELIKNLCFFWIPLVEQNTLFTYRIFVWIVSIIASIITIDENF